MQISTARLQEFQILYKEEFQIDINEKEASDLSGQLILLVNAIRKPETSV